MSRNPLCWLAIDPDVEPDPDDYDEDEDEDDDEDEDEEDDDNGEKWYVGGRWRVCTGMKSRCISMPAGA